MKRKLKWIIAIVIVLIASILAIIPASSEDYGSVNCNYYSVPLNRYICSDGHWFYQYQQMIDYYVPPLEQTTPDYTFVTGGQTEGMSGQ